MSNAQEIKAVISETAKKLSINGYIFLYLENGRITGVADLPLSVFTPLVRDLILEKLK